MRYLARLSSLAAALCLGFPATGFTHGSHGGSCGGWHGNSCNTGWHGGYYCAPHYHPYGACFPFVAGYPYYAVPYYGAPYYGAYYDSPSVGVSMTTSHIYRGTRVDDRADDLAIDVQRALRHDGYYRGDIDGDIGAGTRGAIRQYQYDHHLEVTGRIDGALLRSLSLN
jgi:hypothetical protein